MEILITGATGFIGRRLVSSFAEQGHCVTAMSRSGDGPRESGIVASWRLGEPLPTLARRSYIAAIHLAHDFDGNAAAHETIIGTLRIVEELKSLGVMRQIFLSSLSAGDHANSIYGKSKRNLENILKTHSVTIVRPGLVLGDGGIFGRMRRFILKTSFAPLPDGGKDFIPSIAIDKLCHLLIAISLKEHIRNDYNFFELHTQTLRELLTSDPDLFAKRFFVLPIPSSFLLFGLKVAECLGLSLPVTSDNLIGFLANQNHPYHSNIEDVEI